MPFSGFTLKPSALLLKQAAISWMFPLSTNSRKICAWSLVNVFGRYPLFTDFRRHRSNECRIERPFNSPEMIGWILKRNNAFTGLPLKTLSAGFEEGMQPQGTPKFYYGLWHRGEEAGRPSLLGLPVTEELLTDSFMKVLFVRFYEMLHSNSSQAAQELQVGIQITISASQIPSASAVASSTLQVVSGIGAQGGADGAQMSAVRIPTAHLLIRIGMVRFARPFNKARGHLATQPEKAECNVMLVQSIVNPPR